MNQKDSYQANLGMEALHSRFARQVVSRLSESADLTPHDVSVRLRFARSQALDRARAVHAPRPMPDSVSANGADSVALKLHPGGSGTGWWVRFGSMLPLAVLVLGLVFIQNLHTRSQIDAAAEVDAALLGDDVPVAAYGDPGFVEFLKTIRD